MVMHIDDINMKKLPHPSYIAEKFNASFTGLDNKNQERVKEYCRAWHIDIDELYDDRNKKLGVGLRSA